ncbi:hypothetical protein Y032_0400g767 [Ancylostoma ceylanicum]|uniref:Uncharacterized protein n=1 Tax=Ancylostoma ceylanicum TaxID=53326 RepID=A0A016RRP0_9BILA|nr:hypothetical protein Y032_0400g767 [Ancylostoma ceylanicum]
MRGASHVTELINADHLKPHSEFCRRESRPRYIIPCCYAERARPASGDKECPVLFLPRARQKSPRVRRQPRAAAPHLRPGDS